MRKGLAFLLLGILALAACGSPAPSATPVVNPSAPAPSAVPPTNTPAPTIGVQQRSFMGSDVPVPGTLVKAAATDDPNAGGKTFDHLYLERTGGIAGGKLSIDLMADGTLMRDGKPSKLTADELAQVNTVLAKLSFFSIRGVFTAPGTGPDALQYSLQIDLNGASRTVDAQEGLIPPELDEVFRVLSQLGQP